MYHNKPTITMDFDGVIHSYITRLRNSNIIPDPPVEGIKEVIDELRKKYYVVISSARASTKEGRQSIIEWLNKYSIVVDEVTDRKLPAEIHIDDRCICFDGDTNSLIDKIKSFKPWNR